MDIIGIEYDFQKADYIKAVEKHMENTRHWVWMMPLVGTCLICVPLGCLRLLEGLPNSIGRLIIFVGLPVMGALLALYFRRRARATRFVNRMLRNGRSDSQMFGRQRLELREGCIEQRNGAGCILRTYNDIQKVVRHRDGIMLYDQESRMIIIPCSAFENPEQQEAFLCQVQERIWQAQNAGISDQLMEEYRQDADYILEFTWDRPGFIAAMVKATRLMLATRLGWPPNQVICILIGLLLIFAGFRYIFEVIAVFFLAVGFGFLVPLILIFTPVLKGQIQAQINNGGISRDSFDIQMNRFCSEKITVLRRMNRFDIPYNKVHKVKHDQECVYLLLRGRQFLIIPNSAFSSEEQKHKLIGYIEKKIRYC